jgi:hypothetical protein
MLDELFERALDCIYMHIGIMYSGKNILSVDPNKLESYILPTDPYFIRRMYSLDFLGYMRKTQGSQQKVFDIFNNTRRDKIAGKWAPDPLIKQACLRNFLTKKRQAHLYKIKNKHVPMYESSSAP